MANTGKHTQKNMHRKIISLKRLLLAASLPPAYLTAAEVQIIFCINPAILRKRILQGAFGEEGMQLTVLTLKFFSVTKNSNIAPVCMRACQ